MSDTFDGDGGPDMTPGDMPEGGEHAHEGGEGMEGMPPVGGEGDGPIAGGEGDGGGGLVCGVFFFFFLLMFRRPPGSTPFPYTTLFRSENVGRSHP